MDCIVLEFAMMSRYKNYFFSLSLCSDPLEAFSNVFVFDDLSFLVGSVASEDLVSLSLLDFGEGGETDTSTRPEDLLFRIEPPELGVEGDEVDVEALAELLLNVVVVVLV